MVKKSSLDRLKSDPVWSNADGHAEVEMEAAVALVLDDPGDTGRSLGDAGGEHAQRVVVRLERREEDTWQQTEETDTNRPKVWGHKERKEGFNKQPKGPKLKIHKNDQSNSSVMTITITIATLVKYWIRKVRVS